MTGYRVGHFFADHGVESEVLATVGTVYRFTIDPRPNEFVAETYQVDLMEETPSVKVDLGLFHPKCSKWSDMPNVDPNDHENQIPRAREIAETVATDYVIENKPRAPLRDPVVLNGRMFGLPLAYERAFEATFPIKAPVRQQTLADKTVSPYFYSDRSTEWWRAVKGYTGDYPKQHLAKNALPAAYVQTIVRSWLEATDVRDGTVPQDNNGRAPRRAAENQARLGDGGRILVADVGGESE
jgi:hypothetical protein